MDQREQKVVIQYFTQIDRTQSSGFGELFGATQAQQSVNPSDRGALNPLTIQGWDLAKFDLSRK